ncbi:hypothetical protein ES705_40585 [subsurface metagenome]
MKKFLVMLMVVAMASFLFVGCIPVTPPIDPDDPVDPDPVLPPSVTPVIEKIINVGDEDVEGAEGIISLYSSATQYMNADDVDDGILVKGSAPKYSEVNIYIGGIVVGTGYSYGAGEGFIVFVAEDNLGADGAKTLHATSTQLGFAESTPSTVYAFTLDTVAPEIVNIVVEVDGLAVGSEGTMTVTCSEAIDEDTLDEDCTNIWDVARRNSEGEFVTGLMADVPEYDLISPKVIELSAPILELTNPFLAEGELIRVAYEASEAPQPEEGEGDEIDYVYIKDLAGNNLVESIHYCYLELED